MFVRAFITHITLANRKNLLSSFCKQSNFYRYKRILNTKLFIGRVNCMVAVFHMGTTGVWTLTILSFSFNQKFTSVISMKLNTKFLCKTKYDDYRMCLQAKTLILFNLNPAKLSKHLLFQNFALIKQLYQKPIAVKKNLFQCQVFT